METLLRVQDSPLPAQMVLGDFGSMAMAPMDCAVCLSNMGLKVVPPFTDFHTPPLAAPTYTVIRPFSLTAVSAAMRPLIAAEPMFRAPRPEIESESYFTSCARRYGAENAPLATHAARTKQRVTFDISMVSLKVILQNFIYTGIRNPARYSHDHFGFAFVSALVTGMENSESSSGILSSTYSTVNLARSGLPFCPLSRAKG